MPNSSDQDYRLFDLDSNSSISWKSTKSSVSQLRSKSQLSTSSHQVPSSKLSPEGGPYSLDSTYDCCAFVIHCHKHNKVAVSTRSEVNAQWLPFTPIPPNKTWDDAAKIGSLIVLSAGDKAAFQTLKKKPPYSQVECMSVLRLQLPYTLRFVTRLVYYVKLDPKSANDHFKCCADTKRLLWMSISEVAKGSVVHSWGPELAYFCGLAQSPIAQQVTEYTLSQALVYVPRNPPRNTQESILLAINITEQDVERLYLDYIDHCFPSAYQSVDCFVHYMSKNGFETNHAKLPMLFKAFSEKDNGFLSFHELLIGLALMEPGHQFGELRAKFVFRYYDQDHDGHLNKDELARMLADIHKEDNDQAIHKKVEEALHTMHSDGKHSIGLEQFAKAVASKQFRGTSKLCLSPKDTFAQVSRAIAERTMVAGVKTSLSGIVFKPTYKGTCQTCVKSVKYRLSTHSVKISPTGTVTKAHKLDDCETDHPELAKRSIEVLFNSEHVANLMISNIRHFNPSKGTNKSPNGLMTTHPDQLYALVQSLCEQMLNIIKHESKCHKANPTPCYLIGDIHGNLEDLLSLEKAIWRSIHAVSCNYVFLGDYVDRGRWSLECALYLMAFKVLCPSNVTLLRGNHEVRDLQKNYSYKSECTSKYGDDYGIKIWELTNEVFDRLPVCAVVDRSIYCAHGGIPRSATILDQIDAVELSLNDPQKQSDIAWEILWSDPCHITQFNDMADVTPNSPEDIENGFIDNPKRGTAYFFNEFAAKNFLSNNELSFIVRAHEVPPSGYTFHFGKKCITIFSCSHYCGNKNECAVLLVDQGLLRVIRVDTTNNAPATD